MAESAPPSRRALLAAERAARRDVVTAERELAELSSTEGDGDTPVSGRVWWPMTAVAAILIAVVVGIAGVVRFSQLDSETFSDNQVRSAATDRVALLLTPNMHDPDRSKRILDDSTGAFHDQFAQASDAYTKFVAAVGTVATGQVDGTAIETRDRQSATVLVTASIAVSTTNGDGSGTKRFRLRVQLQPDGGELKLAAVEMIS
jgi:Mce-associated membrane protein